MEPVGVRELPLADILARLRADVPDTLIDWTQKTGGHRATMNVWVVDDLLDFRAPGWEERVDVRPLGGGNVEHVVSLTIHGSDGSLTRVGVGEGDDEDSASARRPGNAATNGYAQAKKRAAASLGLARRLWLVDKDRTPRTLGANDRDRVAYRTRAWVRDVATPVTYPSGREAPGDPDPDPPVVPDPVRGVAPVEAQNVQDAPQAPARVEGDPDTTQGQEGAHEAPQASQIEEHATQVYPGPHGAPVRWPDAHAADCAWRNPLDPDVFVSFVGVFGDGVPLWASGDVVFGPPDADAEDADVPNLVPVDGWAFRDGRVVDTATGEVILDTAPSPDADALTPNLPKPKSSKVWDPLLGECETPEQVRAYLPELRTLAGQNPRHASHAWPIYYRHLARTVAAAIDLANTTDRLRELAALVDQIPDADAREALKVRGVRAWKAIAPVPTVTE